MNFFHNLKNCCSDYILIIILCSPNFDRVIKLNSQYRDKRDSVYSIVPNDPIRFAELSHACAFTRYARVYLDAVCSRCQWLIRSRVIDTSKCGQKIARLWFHTDGTTIFRFVRDYFANEKELETCNYNIFRAYLVSLL